MRKNWIKIAFFALFLALLLPLPLHGEEELPAQEELCPCGRPYYTEDEGVHKKYNCTGCNRDFHLCVCDTCWCGKKLDAQRAENGAVLSMTCVGCDKPPAECDCADREYFLALSAQAGNLAGPQLPKTGGVLLLCAILLPAGVFFLWYLAFYRKKGAEFDAKVKKIGRLKVALDQIEKQEDALSRYRLAKKAEEHKARTMGEKPSLADRKEWKALCFKKDGLLPEALHGPLRRRAQDVLQDCLTDSRLALSGDPKMAAVLWDDGFVPERLSHGAATPGEMILRNNEVSDNGAIFLLSASLCGESAHKLRYGDGRTVFSETVYTPGFCLMEEDAAWRAFAETSLRPLILLVPDEEPEPLTRLPLAAGEFPQKPKLPPVTGANVQQKEEF